MRKEDRKIYNAGHCLDKASIWQRNDEKRILIENGLGDNLYNPIEAPFNDKEANKEAKFLCDEIVKGDVRAIEWANTFIIEPLPHALGTHVELGMAYAYNKMNDYIREILDAEELGTEAKILALKNLIDNKIPKKELYAQYPDIRRHDAPEEGDFRSWGINQFVYGTVRAMNNNKGLQSFEEIIEDLKSED